MSIDARTVRPWVQPNYVGFLMMMQKPLTLQDFTTPCFAFVSTLLFYCRLPKTVETVKMNNLMLHFPLHLFVELSLGIVCKWHFPYPRFPNFLGSMPPPPPPPYTVFAWPIGEDLILIVIHKKKTYFLQQYLLKYNITYIHFISYHVPC